jgi:hypothetical protein
MLSNLFFLIFEKVRQLAIDLLPLGTFGIDVNPHPCSSIRTRDAVDSYPLYGMVRGTMKS